MSYNKIDSAHEFTYPTSPDARGSTRVNHRRRPYYLGPHDSPLSYVMFGLWKHRLQETGEPPSTKEIRVLAEELLERVATVPASRLSTWTRPLALASILVGVLLCAGVVSMIASSSSAPKVDEIVLSESEADVIRAIRIRTAMSKDFEVGPQDSVAELTDRLIAEGISDGARHVARSDF